LTACYVDANLSKIRFVDSSEVWGVSLESPNLGPEWVIAGPDDTAGNRSKSHERLLDAFDGMDALAEKLQCPDPTLREVEIGGNVIIGGVGLHKKPLKVVLVPLYSSSSKKVWTGRTLSTKAIGEKPGWLGTLVRRPRLCAKFGG
jgi:hypothetical protein